MRKIAVFVVDDHRMIREMWSKLFSESVKIEVVGESGEFGEAIAAISVLRPDVVLLDINLRGASGLDAVPLILEVSPDTKVIGVSMHSQRPLAKKMLQLGAKGYVTKNSAHEEIFNAIDQVINGGIYICEEIKHILAEQALNSETKKSGINSLSIRELEIVRLIKKGYSSKQIAEMLDISIKAIEAHRYKILKKLNVKNTASLINVINTVNPFL